MQTAALLKYCEQVWHEMAKRSEPSETLPEALMEYEGYLTKLFQELGLSTPYYTFVMEKLRQMDCVRQIRRGGGGTKSRWALMQEPSEELFQAALLGVAAHKTVRRHTGNDQVAQMVRDLSVRVNRLEEEWRVWKMLNGAPSATPAEETLQSMSLLVADVEDE